MFEHIICLGLLEKRIVKVKWEKEKERMKEGGIWWFYTHTRIKGTRYTPNTARRNTVGVGIRAGTNKQEHHEQLYPKKHQSEILEITAEIGPPLATKKDDP